LIISSIRLRTDLARLPAAFLWTRKGNIQKLLCTSISRENHYVNNDIMVPRAKFFMVEAARMLNCLLKIRDDR